MHCVVLSCARMLQCAYCHIEVLVCAPCDHGQRYCGAGCRQRARLASQCRASKRYQRTRCGSFNHARRQQRLRERQLQVLQEQEIAKNSDSSGPSQEACAGDLLPRLDVMAQTPTKPTPAWHCHWCARPVASGVWRGGLRHATHEPQDDP